MDLPGVIPIMNTTQHIQIQLLRAAKNILYNGSERFICWALEVAPTEIYVGDMESGTTPEDYGTQTQVLQDWIQDLLCHGASVYGTLETWLVDHRPDLPREPSDMLEYRIEWINWMITRIIQEGEVQ